MDRQHEAVATSDQDAERTVTQPSSSGAWGAFQQNYGRRETAEHREWLDHLHLLAERSEFTHQDQRLAGIAAAGRTIATHTFGSWRAAVVIRMGRSAKIMGGFTGAGGQMVPGGVTAVRDAAADHGKVARGEGEDRKGSNDKLAHIRSHASPDSKDSRIRKAS